MNTRNSGWLAIAGRSVAMALAVLSLAMSGAAEAAKGGGGTKPGDGGGGGGGKVKLPAVSLSPASLDFGDQQVNTSTVRAVILSNSGRADLTISIALSGSSAFSQANDCGGTLAPGIGCTISVTFSPTAEGAASGSLVVTSNAASSPDDVLLSGNGTPVPALPTRIEGAGDSIMRGYNASCTRNTGLFDFLCYGGGDQPENSFLDGSSSQVTSLVDYYVQVDPGATGGKAASESGSEMLDPAKNNFATQANAIVTAATTQPVRVFVELGGNDLCNRATVGDLYSDEEWTAAVSAGLDILTQGLPDGSTVVMVSVPRVQDLRAVGIAKQNSTPNVNCTNFWSTFDVCRIATSTDANFVELDARQKAYNQILVALAGQYNDDASATGVEVVAEYVEDPNASVGSYKFQPDDINGGDCFHPSIQGQNKLSEIIWGNTAP